MYRKELFGHPIGLYVLFMTELWERFSYYGMRALLILYLTKHFLFDDSQAGLIYGSYAALIYGLPILGGILADRYLGMRKAVFFGALLLVLGHLSMAIEGPVASVEDGFVQRSEFNVQIFYFSLSLIAVGVGFLKANISTLVGSLYSSNDSRRDSGFTIFYMGINIGAFIATLLCAYVGEVYGWRYGFGLAGIGMVFGLLTFHFGKFFLGDIGLPPNKDLLNKVFFGIRLEKIIYILSLMFVVFIWGLIQLSQGLGLILLLLGFFAVSWIIWFSLKKCNKSDRNNMFAMLILMAFSILFWALFEQAASSITLFTDRNINMGSFFTAGMFQALNPLFIIFLAPLFAVFWGFLSKKGIEPSTSSKFGFAILQVGLGFLVLVFGSQYADSEGRVAVVFLVFMYLLHTMGELCLSPVGLSMVTKLSVPKIVGMMMGVWFLSSSFAAYVSGWIASLMAIENYNSDIVGSLDSLGIYTNVFGKLALIAIVVGIFLLIISSTLSKLINTKS